MKSNRITLDRKSAAPRIAAKAHSPEHRQVPHPGLSHGLMAGPATTHVRLGCLLALSLLLWFNAWPVRATIPEPDNVVWGVIVLGSRTVTAADRDVVVEARRSLTSAALARYRMGDNPSAGNHYCLRLGLESFSPVSNTFAVETNTPVLIVVLDGAGVREQKLCVVGTRGQMIRLNFGNIDTDGNGLPDDWERLYFAGAIGQNPNLDPDQDGLNNRQEWQQGLNPLLADARHPADINPTNNAVSILEVTTYGLAWKTGQAWSVAPANIPIDYVTRASYLWRNGETYWLETNYLAVGAPLWWTNVVTNVASQNLLPPSSPTMLESGATGRTTGVIAIRPSSTVDSSKPATGSIERALPRTYKLGVAVPVTITVVPAPDARAYAVEDQVPRHWIVDAIGANGYFDAVNGKVKWGPFFDAEPRTLNYTITPGGESQNRAAFVGVGSFDGASLNIAGAQVSTAFGLSEFTGPWTAGQKGFAFTHLGEPGQKYEIQVSFDLLNWTSLIQLTSDANGRLDYIDASAGTDRQRFYRALKVSE